MSACERLRLAAWFAGVLVLSGCVTPTNVDLPSAADGALASASLVRAAADDAIAQVEPGSVIDALASLDGCWASILEGANAIGLCEVYSFDADGGEFERITFPLRGDALVPGYEYVTLERGTFRQQSANTLLLEVREIYGNFDVESGRVSETLLPGEPLDEPIERTALVTLDGDRMQLWIDVSNETKDEPNSPTVDADYPVPVFVPVACE
jgi:hypothetical protein